MPERDEPPDPDLPVRFGAYGGTTSVFVPAADHEQWSAALSADAVPWLTLGDGAAGRGTGLVVLNAAQNLAAGREATLTVTFAPHRRPLVRVVAQMTAVPLHTLNDSVLQVPFMMVPRVMELGIAGKFIAEQIAKIPEPFNLIALLVVEIVVVIAGILAFLVRGALAPIVPEPKTWFGVPLEDGYAAPFDPLTQIVPATAVCIAEETVMLAIYIAEQTLSGGE